MHPQAAAALRYADEGRQKVRKLLRQCSELVDHDHQAWQGRRLGAEPIVAEVACTNGSQEAFPTVQFRIEADERTFRKAIVEIGDKANRVREVGARVECRPALVIDQYKRHVVWAELGGEPNDQAAQQLALARTSRAGNERMRPVAHQVHLNQTIDGMSQRRRWSRVRTSRPPSFNKSTSGPIGWRPDQKRVDVGERNGCWQPTRVVACPFRV